MPPKTPQRVPQHTQEHINERIQRDIRRSVTHYARCNGDAIDERLAELDEEWDIERALEFNAATLATSAITMGLFGRKRWFLFAGAVTAFLAQHALQGWCPPVPILRRLGFRTAREIDQERYALKALRGDFAEAGVEDESDPEARVQTVLEAAG